VRGSGGCESLWRTLYYALVFFFVPQSCLAFTSSLETLNSRHGGESCLSVCMLWILYCDLLDSTDGHGLKCVSVPSLPWSMMIPMFSVV